MALHNTIPEEFANVLTSKVAYNDWRDELAKNGFVVIPNVVSSANTLEYQEQANKWLCSYSDAFDMKDPATWTKENLPVQTPSNLYRGYAIQHEKFMWDVRMESGVVGAFSKLWGTDELLVSFDSLNITLPGRTDKPNLGSWEHVDQSPYRRGLHCVQGMVNLSEAGPKDGGLLVYPGSHKHVEEFFDTQIDKALWKSQDFFLFSPEQLEYFAQKGIKPHKVCAKPGDLILWDSRTIHQGCEPEPGSDTTRMVIYVTYTPAKLAEKEALEMKAELFNTWQGSTHWPHDNIVAKSGAILDSGERDPKDRMEPREKPVLTPKLLKLAGVELY